MSSRWVYRALLRLHPAAFRERFADEMLWVFDEMTAAERRFVLRDGAVSLLTQWVSNDAVPRVDAPFGLMPASPFSALRVAQATTVAALVTLGFFKLLTQAVPLPQPPKTFEVRRVAWALCPVSSKPLKRRGGGAPDCGTLQ